MVDSGKTVNAITANISIIVSFGNFMSSRTSDGDHKQKFKTSERELQVIFVTFVDYQLFRNHTLAIPLAVRNTALF